MGETGPEPEWDEIRAALRRLDERVSRIEQRLELPAAAAAASPPVPAPDPGHGVLEESAHAVPVLGRALLGLAGAYVLRALTEAHALSPKTGVFSAILYAGIWLLWAARSPVGRRAETVLYSVTSALVVGPLLWESTLRFHAISTWTAAGILFSFTLFGFLISWHKNLLIVATIATLTGVLTAGALLIGSYDLLPFTTLLLAIAAAVEIAACLEHWLSERWLAAAAADLVVLLVTYLVTSPRGLPESYRPVSHGALLAVQLSLPGVYLSSTLVRTLLRRFTFSAFEAAQLGLAFLLAVGGGLRLAGNDTGSVLAMAAVAVAGALVCYAASMVLQGRNALIYAVFGFLLVVAGTRIALPSAGAAAIWSLVAIAAMASRSPAWRWQSCFYLVCALVASRAFTWATQFVLGAGDRADGFAPVGLEAAVAAVCLALALRGNVSVRLLNLMLAAAAFWLMGAVSATALTASYHGLFGDTAPHAYCGTLRTIVLASGAVLLAWAAAVWKREEFRPLVYLVMVLGAYRLLLVDLRQDGKVALVLSLLAYGGALIVLPRWMQARRVGL